MIFSGYSKTRAREIHLLFPFVLTHAPGAPTLAAHNDEVGLFRSVTPVGVDTIPGTRQGRSAWAHPRFHRPSHSENADTPGLARAIVGASASQAAMMVGDRPETDGQFATTLGCRFAIVWSGVTTKGAVVTPVPDLAADDLAAIADQLIANPR